MRRFALVLLLALAARAAVVAAPAETPRVVSLSPSLTAILLTVGARDAIVGVDDTSAQVEPRVRDLPRVGGLFNPSIEAIVALRPTLVALVPGAQQRELQQRLAALKVEVLALPNISYADVMRSITDLGDRVGRGDAARARWKAIDDAKAEALERTRTELARGVPRVRTVLVLQREPLYVVGRGSFLDEMLHAAGAENLGRRFDEPYPRVSVEWLIDAAPDLILDAADPASEAQSHWAHWLSVPAVKRGRVETLDRSITVPGPYLDRSLAELAARVRGAAK
jgi:ABC-type Fe3+-hydroxamate transport system substrate-binding protein